MSTDRAGAVTEVWGREAQSPAQITHEKADGVLEKSLSNVHTPTIRRCGPLYQQRHCRLRAGWVTESLKQARGVMPGPRYWPANRMVSSPLIVGQEVRQAERGPSPGWPIPVWCPCEE